MITALDTNVLLDVLIPNEEFYRASANAIQNAADKGTLVICDIVYAELCIHFHAQRECDAFLDAAGIRVQSLSKQSLFRASRAWREYRLQGGKRVKILSDFLIGAHAELQSSSLVSRDRGFYQRLFPSLHVLDPSAG